LPGIGLATGKKEGDVVDYLRLDSDEIDPPDASSGSNLEKKGEEEKKTKGIHFNAKRLKDDKKQAFIITPTKGLKHKERESLYMTYVNQIQKVGATELWKIWSSGNVSAHADLEEEMEIH
jgi:hypothetical protein